MRHFSVLALGALIVACASADTQSDFKSFMKSVIPKVENAFETKNVAFFDSIAAPDFVDKAMGQTMTRKQAMAEMKAQLKMTKSMKMNMKLASARVASGVGHAVLTGSATFTTMPGKDGKTHVMTMTFTEHETWVRSGSAWKIKVLEESMGSSKMDGKPMPQGAPGK